ncbi:D-sedoheptulose 7-phosphate isomerase [Candidatus Pacearchaeota archaeon]|nr:D-sedoheptulose 7-phosphate isomerase [Candidatus Pacearchaeota archaeon]
MDEKRVGEVKEIIKESINSKIEFLDSSCDILDACDLIVSSFKSGGKLLICGNGGSAADSQHIAGELVDKFLMDRKGLPAISLTCDTSVLTAWGNDKSFDEVFSRQVEALGKNGDVLIAITTSGTSKNVVLACEKAKEIGMKIVSLTGNSGGILKEMSDVNINSSSNHTPRIQECHMTAYHIICEIVEKEMFGSNEDKVE